MSDAPITEAAWLRLSNWAVLHYVARTLRAMFSNLLAMIPALYGLLQIDDQQLLISAVLGIVSLIILHAVATHLCFSYRMPDDVIHVRQGVIFKKQLNLSIARVQSITFEHPFYFRPLGLVTVKVEGAGSAGEEVFLSALEDEEARALRDELLARKAAALGQTADAEVDEPEVTPDGELLITRDLPNLVLHGLTNNRAWIILGGAGAALGQMSDFVEDKLGEWGIDLSGFLQDQTFAVLLVLAVSAFFTAIAIMAALSVVGSIVSYYGYELYGSAASLTLRRGLLTRHEVHMQKSRVQNVTYQQDWLDSVLGRVNLVFEQIWDQSPAGVQGVGEKVLVPTITPGEANALADRVLIAPNPRELAYTRSNVRYFGKMAAIWTCVWAIPVGFALLVQPLWVAVYPIVGWWLHLLMQNLAWRAKGIAMTQDITVVRSGIIGIEYVVLPTFKVQDIKYVQSRLMERRDLASLHIRTASRTVSMPFIEGRVARQAVDLALWRVETDERSWM